MQDVLERCRSLEGQGTQSVAGLAALVSGPIQVADLPPLRVVDARRPYGRNVVLAGTDAEVMVATWTPGIPCAPHDHGGSVGAVRVLRGVAVHRVWALERGELRVALEERVEEGQVLACGPGLIHSMVDGGASEPLMTLHVYSGAIPFMVVYDLAARQTLQVEASCGAWIPESRYIQASMPGFVSRAALVARS